MLAGLVDHLWQSTLYAVGVTVLAAMLHRADARYRYWLWFSASVKFLLPFAWLEKAGRQFADWGVPHIPLAAAQEAMPAVRAIRIGADPAIRLGLHQNWDGPLTAIWASGLLCLLALWVLRWRQLRRMVREADDIPGMGDVPVMSSASSLEPGVIGILDPVVVFPRTMIECLSQTEFASLLEHEKAHLERRDNLLSVLQMLVEGLFWFYPPVWWLGARLVQERELACDEHVVAAGHHPRTYAESILKACRLCLGSPLICAAGVSRRNLKGRIERIVSRQIYAPLNGLQKFLLAWIAATVLLGPVCAGLVMPQVPKAVLTHIARQGTALLRRVAILDDAEPAAPMADRPIRRRAHHIAASFVQFALRRDMRLSGSVPVSALTLPPMEQANDSPAPAHSPPARKVVQDDGSAKAAVVNTVAFGDPTGAGDPTGITCRQPQQLPGSRVMGPRICLANGRWRALARQGLHYSAAGQILTFPMESPSEDESVHMVYVNCRDVAMCGDARSVLDAR